MPRPAAVAAVLLWAAAVPAPAVAQEIPIQPGAAIETAGIGCTMAWIVEGRPLTPQAGGTFAVTAGHCSPGAGAEVRIRPQEDGGPGAERIGTVVVDGDQTGGGDYAFFRIDDEDLWQVAPAMKGHPTLPMGLTNAPKPGDQIVFSGYGAGFKSSETLREDRFGSLNRIGVTDHDVTGPVAPGDSGGPVANTTDGGTALGIVTDLTVGFNTAAQTVVVAGEKGLNLRHVLADAASRGFHVRLLLANGQPASDGEDEPEPEPGGGDTAR